MRQTKRVKEWWRVVKYEAGLEGVGWADWNRDLESRLAGVLWRMASALILGEGSVADRVWRARIRVCASCPIYDRGWKQCRLVDGGREMGCGCYVPFMAKVRAPYGKGCWWREYMVGEGGWGSEK